MILASRFRLYTLGYEGSLCAYYVMRIVSASSVVSIQHGIFLLIVIFFVKGFGYTHFHPELDHQVRMSSMARYGGISDLERTLTYLQPLNHCRATLYLGTQTGHGRQADSHSIGTAVAVRLRVTT